MVQTAMESKRVMFVWLPNFAMRLARARWPRLAHPHEPLALLEKHGNIRRIAALDEPAIRAGLYLHQPLADALAVCPKLVCADAEPDAVQEALMALAVWAQRYSPATAPALPCGLWLDITGCAHLWDSEDGLAENLIARLEARGGRVLCGQRAVAIECRGGRAQAVLTPQERLEARRAVLVMSSRSKGLGM